MVKMNRVIHSIVALVVAIALSTALLVLSTRLWGSAELQSLSGVGDIFGSLFLLVLAITLCAVPFAAAGTIGVYFLHRSEFGSSVQTGAWLSVALTTAFALVAELTTWHAMFQRGPGNSTSSIAFLTIPLIGLVVAAASFVLGMLGSAAADSLRHRKLRGRR